MTESNRVDLIESRDYGRCSLVKALKSVLERMDVENTIYTKIGYPLMDEHSLSQRWQRASIKKVYLVG